MTYRIKGLDGLRAIAISWVFLDHKVHALAGNVGLSGYGVHLFFVLSGFLIIGILHEQRRLIEQGESFYGEWKKFMLKRSFRIFPIYFITIAFAVVAFHPPTAIIAQFLTYTANLSLILPPHAFLAVGGHLWSLSVEEQFYVVAAPLFLLVPSRHTAVACWLILAAASLASLAIAVSGLSGQILYGGPVTNFGLMAMGGIAALSKRLPGLPQWAGAAALLSFAACPYLGYALQPLFGGAISLLIFFLLSPALIAILLANILSHQESRLVKILHVYPLRALGRISYAFYLFHDFISFEAPPFHMWNVAAKILDLAATLGLAALSWVTIEAPLQRFGRRLIYARGVPEIRPSA